MNEDAMSENKKVSIKDMAKACGVSVATISRAFKEGTEINQKTRQAIVEKQICSIHGEHSQTVALSGFDDPLELRVYCA